MTALSAKLGRKASDARQRLLQYILDSGLASGDRLPPQSKLREVLKLGTPTIVSALTALQEEGLVEIRDRVGVFVKEYSPNGIAGRTIGIGAPAIQGTPFSAMLMCFLQSELQKIGCRAVPFFNSRRTGIATVANFPGLELAVRSRQLHGFISLEHLYQDAWQRLIDDGIEACYIGVNRSSPFCIAPAFDDYTKDALALCRARHAERTELILSDPGYAQRHGPFPADVGVTSIAYHSNVGGEIMEQLLRREGGPPDSLVFYDDIVVANFCGQALAHTDWRPHIVALRNMQIPLSLPFDNVDYFDLDIQGFARLGIQLLLDRIRGENRAGGVVTFPLRRGPTLQIIPDDRLAAPLAPSIL